MAQEQKGPFRIVRNESFVCAHCGLHVSPLRNGSCRNHCPRCLWSLHVDNVPGDRRAGCGGALQPIAVRQDARRGWIVVHRCTRCGAVRANRAALDDPRQPDDVAALVNVAARAAEQSLQGLGREAMSRRGKRSAAT